MNKKISLLLICALLLTGCARTDTSSDSAAPNVTTSATGESDTSPATESTAETNPHTETPAAQTYTQQDIINALDSYGRVYRDYIFSEITAAVATDATDTITADDGTVLYKAALGEVTDRASLYSALRSVMTSAAADSAFDEYNGKRFAISDGALYLALVADVYTAPYNELCLTAVEDAGEKLLVTLTAYGDSESFKDYNITLVKTADGLRADENTQESVILALVQYCVQETPAESPLKSERAQLRRLLCDYGAFYRDYLSAKKTRALTDPTDYITEGETKFYRVAYGDVTTEEEMLAAMRRVAADERINAELMSAFSAQYRVSDGNIYLSENAGYDGTMLGTDEVWLDSAEEQDGVIALTLIAYSRAQSWDNLDADEFKEFTVKVEKTDSGLRVCAAGVLENSYLSCFDVTEKAE